jgi:hypothetical protein
MTGRKRVSTDADPAHPIEPDDLAPIPISKGGAKDFFS